MPARRLLLGFRGGKGGGWVWKGRGRRQEEDEGRAGGRTRGGTGHEKEGRAAARMRGLRGSCRLLWEGRGRRTGDRGGLCHDCQGTAPRPGSALKRLLLLIPPTPQAPEAEGGGHDYPLCHWDCAMHALAPSKRPHRAGIRGHHTCVAPPFAAGTARWKKGRKIPPPRGLPRAKVEKDVWVCFACCLLGTQGWEAR